MEASVGSGRSAIDVAMGQVDPIPRLLRPCFSYGHEPRAAFQADGVTWGLAGYYRGEGPGGFSAAEADFVAGIAPLIARGLRASLVVTAAQPSCGSGGPAVIHRSRRPDSLAPSLGDAALASAAVPSLLCGRSRHDERWYQNVRSQRPHAPVGVIARRG